LRGGQATIWWPGPRIKEANRDHDTGAGLEAVRRRFDPGGRTLLADAGVNAINWNVTSAGRLGFDFDTGLCRQIL
jgi:hypothetical protein